MTLYELVNNTTIQGNAMILPFNMNGDELAPILINDADDVAGYSGEYDDYEDWEVTFIYVDRLKNLVIEVQEEE